MLKVCLVLPSLKPSGAVKQVRWLAQALRERECQVRVLALQGGAAAKTFQNAGIACEVLGRGWSLDPRPWLRLWQRLRTEKPDVVHLWETGERQGVCPTWNLPRLVVRRATSARLATDAGPPVALVDPPTGKTSAELLQELNLPTDARLILCAGRFERCNGFMDALWALDILQFVEHNAHLLLAGDGPERDRLEQFARATGVFSRVRFLGWRDDLSDWLRLADVVWSPSQVGALPSVVLEAMALGRPVVAANLPQVRHAITDDVNGLLVPPKDKPALARQTLRLLRKPALGERLSAAAQAHALKHFSYANWIEWHWTQYVDDAPAHVATQRMAA